MKKNTAHTFLPSSPNFCCFLEFILCACTFFPKPYEIPPILNPSLSVNPTQPQSNSSLYPLRQTTHIQNYPNPFQGLPKTESLSSAKPAMVSSDFYNPSVLLDLAADDDLEGFKNAVNSGASPNGSGLWYGTRVGSRRMGYEERTPLMVASLFGSTKILTYILANAEANPNLTAGSDAVSALHLAVSGASPTSPTAVEILLNASANPNLLTSNGLKPSDLIAPKSPVSKKLRLLLGAGPDSDPVSPKSEPGFGGGGGVQMPDINTGVYSSDDFRMYSFKIKPCSRAYTHDWTECPFAHPGENARRRDPTRHPYSCVPCPEFKKGACRKSDDCEFAHGVFESWLHPAQYRTRLCKDETGCSRKVCFFAHRKDELRPVYASTGSALPGSMDPPSPQWASSPKKAASPPPPPTLQLQGGSRLRSSSSARDLDFEIELLKSQIAAQQSQLGMKPANNNNMDSGVFGLAMSPLSLNQLRSSYPVHHSARKLSPTEFDSSPKSVAMLNSRAAFAQRSQSFIDRGAHVGSPVANGYSSYRSNWASGDGRVDWSVQGDDLNKLRRSASFGIRGGANVNPNVGQYGSVGFRGGSRMEEPDVSWVSSLVKDVAPPCSPWVDQVCT